MSGARERPLSCGRTNLLGGPLGRARRSIGRTGAGWRAGERAAHQIRGPLASEYDPKRGLTFVIVSGGQKGDRRQPSAGGNCTLAARRRRGGQNGAKRHEIF
jgi:hypothetical protein